MKHGPIALVDEHTPSGVIVPQGAVYDKVLSNLQEVKARGGPVIAIVDHHDPAVAKLADDVILIPESEDFLQPVVTAIPSSCTPTRSLCFGVVTSTSLETWRKVSRSSNAAIKTCLSLLSTKTLGQSMNNHSNIGLS